MQANEGNSFTGHIAGAIRAEMARQRMEFVQVASIIHVSRATAYRRINGEIPFDVTEIEAIGRHLGVTVDEIFASAELGAEIEARRVKSVAA
ncbi:helix-turn-helix transcriptional regulator [Microbacterium sp. 69-10]|uniref:helix-turn-helix domain-containing protein n=1 Tax=Microbacterium sp. 69-10 TaxID=1895783 RepID=UPI0025D37785|nr:helix-turn-helix transcriptional regulator [Microbacterium sp. 69-10]